MSYLHFLGQLQATPLVLFWETPYRYVTGSVRM